MKSCVFLVLVCSVQKVQIIAEYRAVLVANTIHQEGAGRYFRLTAYFVSSLTVLLCAVGDSIPFLWDTRPRH